MGMDSMLYAMVLSVSLIGLLVTALIVYDAHKTGGWMIAIPFFSASGLISVMCFTLLITVF